MKLSLFDGEYNKIPDNKAKLYSKVGNKTLTSICAFLDIYNYTIAINCSINDFNVLKELSPLPLKINSILCFLI